MSASGSGSEPRWGGAQESDRAELSARFCFGGNRLDRLGTLRDDSAAIEALFHDAQARAVLFAGDTPLLRRDGDRHRALHALARARDLGALRDPILLGRDETGPVFAVAIDGAADDMQMAGTDYLPVGLRAVALQSLVGGEELGILAQGKAVLDWHERHRVCARCGGATLLSQGGWRRDCAACGAQHFPRTDPVAIMLVVHGEDCLLARQPRFPEGMMSCLAGFVEPGETLEDAVRREVAEEVGIRIGRVRYLASQPWPFPSSLMLGCIAEALTREIVLDDKEIEAARWFPRAELDAFMEGRHPSGLTPSAPIAIAHHLVRAFMAGERP